MARGDVERWITAIRAGGPGARVVRLEVDPPRRASPFWKKGWKPVDDRERLIPGGDWDGTAIESTFALDAHGLVAVWRHAPTVIDARFAQTNAPEIGEETLRFVDAAGNDRALASVPVEALRTVLDMLRPPKKPARRAVDADALARRLRALAADARTDRRLAEALRSAFAKLSEDARALASAMIAAEQAAPNARLTSEIAAAVEAALEALEAPRTK